MSASEKARRAKELHKKEWTKAAVSLHLSEQRHNETILRKKKIIREAMRLNQLGYRYSTIGRELHKNPITIKQYITKEITAVSKAVDYKKRSSILSSFYTDINQNFERVLMVSTIEELIRQKGYKGSSSLVRHYVSGMKKDRQRTNERLAPCYYTIQRHYVVQLLYQSKHAFKKSTTKESLYLFEQYPYVKELYDMKQRFMESLKCMMVKP